MQSTSNVGNVENAGYTQQLSQGREPLPRLNPRQIAVMLLPTEKEPVTVERATDEQFQRFVTACGLNVADDENEEWSFDDRCRLINHGRKYGIDIFVEAMLNNSEPEPKQLANNSTGELFDDSELATEASQS